MYILDGDSYDILSIIRFPHYIVFVHGDDPDDDEILVDTIIDYIELFSNYKSNRLFSM